MIDLRLINAELMDVSAQLPVGDVPRKLDAQNGLLCADRRPKFPIAAIAAATGGTSDRTHAVQRPETDGAGVKTSGGRED